MKILTLENKPYDIDCVPDQIEDIRYCVFDGGDEEFQDYYFLPLIFLESFIMIGFVTGQNVIGIIILITHMALIIFF